MSYFDNICRNYCTNFLFIYNIYFKEEFAIKNNNYLIVGTFDISKYDNTFTQTTTEVILTHERRNHIIENHPEVKECINNIGIYLENPDEIYIQNNVKDTIWIIKRLKSNLKITLKINTLYNGKDGNKNSIIQMQYMHDSEVRRNINNGNIKKIWTNNIDNLMNV